MTGARLGQPTIVHRLVGSAIGRDLRAFIVPGREIADLAGVDIERAGMRIVSTPRHANVLLLVGSLPDGLAAAAAVSYAQMPRPRVILALGSDPSPFLPEADITARLEPDAVASAVALLGRRLADGAFSTEVADFAPGVLQVETQYVCPMHPEVVQSEPGSCPICGMDLIPREAVEHGGQMVQAQPATHHDHGAPAKPVATGAVLFTCPMHPEVVQPDPGSCPICGMPLVPRQETEDEETRHEHTGMSHDHELHHSDEPETMAGHDEHASMAGGQAVPPEHPPCQKRDHYTEPAREHHDHDHVDAPPLDHGRPSVPGHTPAQAQVHDAHAAHPAPDYEEDQMSAHPMDHAMAHVVHSAATMETDPAGQHDGMDHGGHGGGFMSMIAVTKHLPRSADGLPMEWLEVPFGPLLPGLPGGLNLRFTLDGSTVAKARVAPGTVSRGLEARWPGPLTTFLKHFGELDRLAPGVYALLARRAASLGGEESESVLALERARVVSHLAWLASFAYLLGDRWLDNAARRLLLAVHRAACIDELVRFHPRVVQLERRALRRPLVRERLSGIGRVDLGRQIDVSGPVVRAAGISEDSRLHHPAYSRLDFSPVVRTGGDALARLAVRLAEIVQSFELIAKATAYPTEQPVVREVVNGMRHATVETPRGVAVLHMTVDGDQVTHVHLESPSRVLVSFVPEVAEGAEVDDALIAVASLDLSPWEIDR